jgi:hypothetical protein
MGSRDKVPRKGNRWRGWAEEVTQRYEAAEYFDEDVSSAWELNQKLYRSKHVPLKYRMYAAGKMVDIEPRPVSIEVQNEKADEAADFIIGELQKLRRASVYDLDRFLHQGIAAGKYTEETALEIRGFWFRKRSRAQEHADESVDEDIEIPDWEPVNTVKPPPAPAPAPIPELLEYIERTAPEPQRHFNGKGSDLRLYPPLGCRYNIYKTISGRKYEVADEGVEPDEADRSELVGAGWWTG